MRKILVAGNWKMNASSAMVEELLEQPGSAYDPVLFEFTSEVTNDQTAEIEGRREMRPDGDRHHGGEPSRSSTTASARLWSPSNAATCPLPPFF